MIACSPQLRLRLTRVAQELDAPDLLIRGALVWNAYTGETYAGDIAVAGDRIARAGPGPFRGPVGPATEVVEGEGRTAVPGYIEPHTHAWPFINPLSLGEAAVCRGTTCLVCDELLYHIAFGPERLNTLTGALSQAALPHLFWAARMASQSRFEGEEAFFRAEVVSTLLEQPHFLATAETTRWTDFLDPSRAGRLLEIVERARRLGKFADGHTAGASARKLPALAAAGLRSCHEAIDTSEALERLRQGLWVLLRNSSLREDLPTLLPVLGSTLFADRFAFTTDGAKAHHVREVGLTDHLIRLALSAGVPEGHAYRMATLNAASLLGLDQDLGSLAPGRIAHVNLLETLRDPTPAAVVCRGRLCARDGALTVVAPSASFDWSLYDGGAPSIPPWGPELFTLPDAAPDPFPAGRLVNAVITREAPTRLERSGGARWPSEDGEPCHVLALTDRRGSFLSLGVIRNLDPNLRGLASSYTTNGGIVVLGTSPESMADALSRLRALGGGIVVLPTGGEPKAFRLPLVGIQMAGEFEPAAAAAADFQETLVACGYPHADPNYTLLFLSCDFLPDLRATEAGWIRSKTGEVLLPARRFG
ncbi:MAG: adenine deaminase [Deltaproteobacteria bacterium]|nr:adenine deaminase [Deltaproteobacteria bacterium]